MKKAAAKFSPDDVWMYVDDVFGADIHAKRVQSVASAVIGVLASESLAVAAIGQGLAHPSISAVSSHGSM